MLYVVCTYIGLCLIALIVLPGKTNDSTKEKSSASEKKEKNECVDINKLINEIIEDG